MTLVDKAALTAALAERDAARAEVARLRAAMEARQDAMEKRLLQQSPSWFKPLALRRRGNEAAEESARVIVAGLLLAALAATEDQP